MNSSVNRLSGHTGKRRTALGDEPINERTWNEVDRNEWLKIIINPSDFCGSKSGKYFVYFLLFDRREHHPVRTRIYTTMPQCPAVTKAV